MHEYRTEITAKDAKDAEEKFLETPMGEGAKVMKVEPFMCQRGWGKDATMYHYNNRWTIIFKSNKHLD